MRAVKTANGHTTFLSSQENRIFRKCETEGFCQVNTLTEREQYIASEMYKKGILVRAQKSNNKAYEIAQQVTQLKG